MTRPTFGIKTSRDFLAKLEADFADFQKEPDSARLALNCALTCYHLHEWVWGEWLKGDRELCRTLDIGDKDDFLGWLDREFPWFPVIQELANGTKHFRSVSSFEARRVSLLPSASGLPNAGAEESHWDGPLPFLTGEPAFLLLDFGPDAAEHRWMLVGMLLDSMVRFWRGFFVLYAPARTS